MSKPYYFSLTKDTVINGQEIKARSPLIVLLFEGETPEKHTLNVIHEVARAGIGGPVWIGNIPLKEIESSIKWIGKK